MHVIGQGSPTLFLYLCSQKYIAFLEVDYTYARGIAGVHLSDAMRPCNQTWTSSSLTS